MQHPRQLGVQVAGMQFVSLITPGGEEAWQVESHNRILAVAEAVRIAGVRLAALPGSAWRHAPAGRYGSVRIS
jgi:hypothetical protein